MLWLIPFLGLLIPFALVPEQGLMSPNCTEHSFLAEPPFRITFSALILVPTVSIIVLYGCFHTLLWRNRDVSTSVISKQVRISPTFASSACNSQTGGPEYLQHAVPARANALYDPATT